MVPKRTRRWRVPDTGELAVINVGNGLNVEVHRGEHGRNRAHDHGVRYEPPLDSLSPAMDWVKQCSHALKKQHDDDPYDNPNGRSEHRSSGG